MEDPGSVGITQEWGIWLGVAKALLVLQDAGFSNI